MILQKAMSDMQKLTLQLFFNVYYFSDYAAIPPRTITDYPRRAKTYNVPSILGVWLFPVLALVINLSFIKQKRLSPINSIAFGIIAIIMTVFYINAL